MFYRCDVFILSYFIFLMSFDTCKGDGCKNRAITLFSDRVFFGLNRYLKVIEFPIFPEKIKRFYICHRKLQLAHHNS